MKNRSHQYTAASLAAQTTESRRPARLAAFTLLTAALLAALAANASGQNQGQSFNSAYPQASANKEYLGPVGDSIKPYRPAGRDPFKKVIKPKPKPTSGGTAKSPKPLGYPSLEERRAKFRNLVDDYGNRGLPEPSPAMQYLVSELEITGVFRDSQGYGAFVRAVPTGTTMFLRRGARCYNGEVLRIENDTSSSGSKVTFRQESFVDVDGKQLKQENVVTKAPTTAPRAN